MEPYRRRGAYRRRQRGLKRYELALILALRQLALAGGGSRGRALAGGGLGGRALASGGSRGRELASGGPRGRALAGWGSRGLDVRAI